MSADAQPKATAADNGYRLFVLFVLFLHYTLNYLDRQIIAILALPIKTELHLTDTQLGLLGGFAFALFYSTFAIPIAWLADRTNRTRILAGALALWSGFTIVCGLATNFWQMFLCRLGVGVGEAGGVPPSYSLLSDYFPPEQRARAIAVVNSGIPIGSAIGLVLGGYVAAEFGWRAAFFLVGLLGLLVAPIMWLAVREPQRGRFDPNFSTNNKQQSSVGATLTRLMKLPSFWLLSFSMGSGAMVLYGFGFWLPAFFQRSHGLDLRATSLLMGALVLFAGLLGNLVGGYLGDKLGSWRRGFYAFVPAISFIVGLPLLIAALWADNPWLAFALFLIPQACGVVGTSPTAVAVQNLGSPANRTMIVALYIFIVNVLGLGLGAVVLGAISDALNARYGDEALRYSLMAVGVLLYPLTALLYALAGWRLPRDWYDANAAENAGA